MNLFVMSGSWESTGEWGGSCTAYATRADTAEARHWTSSCWEGWRNGSTKVCSSFMFYNVSLPYVITERTSSDSWMLCSKAWMRRRRLRMNSHVNVSSLKDKSVTWKVQWKLKKKQLPIKPRLTKNYKLKSRYIEFLHCILDCFKKNCVFIYITGINGTI